MSIKSKIRDVFFKSAKGEALFYKLRILREKKALATLTDEEYIRKTYKERYGKEIDLVNPTGFGEKLQWLKLFYRDEKMPICSDKYRMREYLKDSGLEGLANDLLGVYQDAREIDFDKLPDKFVAKANHGSGWNLICKDKSKLNRKDSVRLMNSWLKLNLYVFGREWNYKDIDPRIVVEKFIEYEPLNDYKLMCFNGKPLYMQLNNDYQGKHYVDFYDVKTWEHMPITYQSFSRSERQIEKPAQLEKMIELARKLSKPFPFVRVDFYNFDNIILLGELTFFPSSGMWPIIPTEKGYDELFGSQLTLPEPNHNLKLLAKCKEKAGKK